MEQIISLKVPEKINILLNNTMRVQGIKKSELIRRCIIDYYKKTGEWNNGEVGN